MEHISCGPKKDHTLKITQLYGLKLLKFPKGVPTTKYLEYENNTYVNDLLWAKDVDVHDDKFQAKTGLLEKIKGLHLEVPDGVLEKPWFTYNHDQQHIKEIWKDDWSEEYEGAAFFQSSFLPKMPPPEWGDREALREWVSNALDVTPEGEKVDVDVDEHGNIILEYDSSDERILSIRHLGCLGSHEEAISTKKGIIGRFGEGIKQANVIFMRKNRWMKIEAVGYTYYPVWGYDKMAESYLVHTYRVPNDRKHGTKITILNVENPEGLISNTKRLYLRWRSDYQVLFTDVDGNQILSEFHSDPPNSRRVSVNGSLTETMEGEEGSTPLLFNYNIIADEEEKEKLVDRDRKFADIDEIRWKARQIFKQLGPDQKDIIQKICEEYNKTRGAPIDLKIGIGNYISEDNLPTWKEAVDNTLRKTMFFSMTSGVQPKIAITYNEFKDQNLRTLGWNIVDWGSSGNTLLEKCGYKYSKDFNESIGMPRVLALDELETEERRVFDEAKRNLQFLLMNYWKEDEDYIDMLINDSYYNNKGGIAVASSFQGCEEAEDLEGVRGMYRTSPDDRIYILRDCLRDGVIDTTGTLIHEFLHKYYDVRDETRAFENRFTALSGKTSHEWAQIQEAVQAEYERTKDPVLLAMLPYQTENKKLGKPKEPSMQNKRIYVEITDIYKDDETYEEKDKWIGKRGYFEQETSAGDDWYGGWFWSEDIRVQTYENSWYFYMMRFTELDETPSDMEKIRCWQCGNVSVVKDNPQLVPLFEDFPRFYTEANEDGTLVDNKTECGRGDAKDWPFFQKPDCDDALECWKCAESWIGDDTGPKTKNLLPVSMLFPRYYESSAIVSTILTKCGEGKAEEWPYFRKPMCIPK